MSYERIKRDWEGQTAVIFASGPSVSKKDIDLVGAAHDAGRCKVIAINAMYQKVEYADLLYFCDFKFYKWHAIDEPDPRFLRYPAPKYSITPERFLPPDIRRLKRGEPYGLSRAPDTLNHGSNSGYQCLNLAYLKGCPRIVMVGYDMKIGEDGKTHCHDPHHIPTPPDVYDNISKAGYFESIATELYEEGVEVINTSIDSALHCFTKMPLECIIF